MKKYIILFSILLASCNAPVSEPQGAGYWIGGDGTEKYVVASDELTEIYSNWIEAHNNKDIDAILSLQTDSIRIALSNGNVIEGKDAHAEALSNYFTTDPNWNMYWALPYKAVSKGEEWIIAGQYVTNTSADGEETAVQRMIDAQFVDGLLNWVIVYDKQPPSQD